MSTQQRIRRDPTGERFDRFRNPVPNTATELVIVRHGQTAANIASIYAFGTIVWIFVLKQVPLTIAYSFMGLTFCFVPLLAQLFLGEALTLRYFLGVALIIGGMVAINS